MAKYQPPTKNYERYFKAFRLRYIDGYKLSVVAKELGLKGLEWGRHMANWVKHQINNPSCINKKVLEFKKSLTSEDWQKIKKNEAELIRTKNA